MAAEIADDASFSLEKLQNLIQTLRGKNGCPWDRKQTPETIANYLIEEIFELVEAITADDANAIGDELGDVLFQVMFIVELFQEQQRLTLRSVLERVIEKMTRRHPHVFGTEKEMTTGQVKAQWREIKRKEKRSTPSLLDTVPSGLPALMRSYRVSERAAGTGFDWESLGAVIEQAEAEWAEFKAEAMPAGDLPADRSKVAMEFGDVLFTLANVARLAGIHPETALSQSTRKFILRFQHMEKMAAQQGRALDGISMEEMERMWAAAKRADKSKGEAGKDEPSGRAEKK